MKRMRIVLGLLTGVLLVIALALPTAVLAQESAATTAAEASAEEVATETAPPTEAETSPEEEAPESAPPTEPGTTPEEETPESAPPTEPGTTPEEETPESNGVTIGALISTVQSFNLKRGIENSLNAKLQNAKDSLDAANADQREDAVNKLQAFINACEAQRGKVLTSDQADELIEDANTLIAGL